MTAVAATIVPANGNSRRLDGVRVALADDHDDVRRILALSLEELGAHVAAVSSGTALVERCASDTFDVALIDIHMPRTDGIATLRELRRRDIGLPALAVTADVTASTSQECAAVGFAGVVAKPFRIADLVAAIRPLIRARDHITNGEPQKPAALNCPESPQDNGVDTPLYSDLVSLSPRLAEATAQFVVHLGDDIERLLVAARNEDSTTLRETAHRLKGAGGINGYFCVSDVASKLEHAIIRRDFDAAKRLIAQIGRLHVRMVDGLKTNEA